MNREEIAREMDCPASSVRDLLHAARRPISLHAPIGNDNDGTLVELIEDRTAASPLELADANVRREKLRSVLAKLPENERRVIEMRYGLAERPSQTLQQVGCALNLTYERIRQIEKHTLEKLELLPETRRLRTA